VVSQYNRPGARSCRPERFSTRQVAYLADLIYDRKHTLPIPFFLCSRKLYHPALVDEYLSGFV
jgi:hypothetical protein